jgi:Patatin-like phospholipase
VNPTEGSPDVPRYPAALAGAEADLVKARRERASVEDGEPLVGVALSGGGLRSAILSLGALQALAHRGVLAKVDYLSTVSGGGYAGIFLGGLFARPATADADKPRAEEVREVLLKTDPPSFPVSWLQDNGRYLAPNGGGDEMFAAAVLIRNWLTIWVVLGLYALTFLLLVGLLRLLDVFALLPWLCNARGASVLCTPLLDGRLPVSAPLLVAPLFVFGAWILPSGWAYWLVSPGEQPGRWAGQRPWLGQLIVGGLCLAAITGSRAHEFLFPGARGIIPCLGLAISLLSLLFCAVAYWCAEPASRKEGARDLLSKWLALGMSVFLGGLAIALLDAGGWWVYRYSISGSLHVIGGGIAALLPTLTAIAANGQRLLAWLRPGKAVRPPRLPLPAVALIVATLLLGALLVLVSAAAYALILSCPFPGAWWLRGGCLALVGLGVCWAVGQVGSFVNRSSLSSFYAARLIRTFLGASNPARADAGGQRVTDVLPKDDLDLKSYRPHEQGGPLHLINVTINETLDGRSAVEQRDRKGVPMAIGPAGVSVGARHHASWSVEKDGKFWDLNSLEKGGFPVFFQEPLPAKPSDRPRLPIKAELLTVGVWAAISGAAVSTGLGSRTSLGYSLLCGTFNLRLGHWWNSGVDPRRREGTEAHQAKPARGAASLERRLSLAFTVQMQLLEEFLARFHGTARKGWYLTDGGHFDNTGGYELIRRRLPFIVIFDHDADPDYQFTDVVNLVRKVRQDFGAEISFLSEAELDAEVDASVRPAFGTLEQFQRGKWSKSPSESWTREPATPGFSKARAALARVAYGEGKAPTTLMLVRPVVVGGESADVADYAANHETFPNESTADQFFNDAQWESYRKLAFDSVATLFAPAAAPAGGFLPSRMTGK